MPELPEVETTLRGIKPHILGKKVENIVIRHESLRWPIPKHLNQLLKNKNLKSLRRRSKYILFEFANGTLILHLGMSGRLCVLSEPVQPKKHDHVDIYFNNKKYLRFTDPRRFGAILWTTDDPEQHALLKNIGPEPLSSAFTGKYLFEQSRKRKVSVKAFIMNSAIVAGVGNIYATESLFAAKIHPEKAAGKLSLDECDLLVNHIKRILKLAIKKGGTTLKDFLKSDGSPGYFSIQLKVYGKDGKPCPNCKTVLKLARIGQRSTVYCAKCQR